ncbi:hypothetical protein CC85DRAFT_281877 [Cutaneotrichosporon oleaginosum]|uniref:Uncharacterized protein n=1 Tax=Cutaneotrichosporon oleaginosum TaxID=879819 RepID=A0A0J0XYU3_9TREE|nr:uncharacterized protein CC85DRAFT_281877 [Cutaneotrichosporon oleaginosum]KLT46225.1 hypothetical protein CC85DRAFT_281877 [Cutaneotrichosporon oleaginosum]TXT10232.1 hypothetical protein COLE_04166 [Cutaneotrichosporon oleaginosum]
MPVATGILTLVSHWMTLVLKQHDIAAANALATQAKILVTLDEHAAARGEMKGEIANLKRWMEESVRQRQGIDGLRENMKELLRESWDMAGTTMMGSTSLSRSPSDASSKSSASFAIPATLRGASPKQPSTSRIPVTSTPVSPLSPSKPSLARN